MTIFKPSPLCLRVLLIWSLLLPLLPAWGQPADSQVLNLSQPQLLFTRQPAEDLPQTQPDGAYPLDVGDQFKLVIWNARLNLSYDLQVNPQGQILVPRLGTVQVKGQTVGELQAQLQTRMRQLQADPVAVQVFLQQVRRVPVLITGRVQRPGTYQLYWGTPLLEALRRAGGIQDNGSVRQIQLKGSQNKLLDLLRFHYLGEQAANPVLWGGEHIHVPALSQRVALLGEVLQPGIYEILPQETAADLLRWAGGTKASAVPAGLQRWPGGLDQSQAEPPVSMALEMPLAQGDILYAPPRTLALVEQQLFVRGQVRQTGAQPWRSGLTVLDCLQQAGGELPNADLGGVLISRQVGGQRQELRVNLQAFLNGADAQGNPEVLPGDSILVPESFFNVRNITELTTLLLTTLGIISVVVNISGVAR